MEAMMEASLAVQKAIRARLVDTTELLQLVPAENIFDRHHRPERFPCVILGQAFALYPDYLDVFHTSVTADVNVWTDQPDMVDVKTIAAAVREALWQGPWSVDDHHCVNLRMEAARFLRDPDGIHGHAVLTIEVILQERLS
jgi:hypothetical protein